MLNTAPQIQYSAILDFVYPVGSYFITESADYNTVAKVQAHFGGTWVQVTERFLYGSTSAGATGGSADAVVVSHTHTLRSLTDNGFIRWGTNVGGAATYVGPVGGTTTYTSGGPTMWNDNTGVDGTGKNMPPYRTVYMYRRTA